MKTCTTCNTKLWRKNSSGFCRSCWGSQPEVKAQRKEWMTNRWKTDPEFVRITSRRSDIPTDKLEDYIRLTRKQKFTAAEARTMLGLPQR